MLLSVSALWIGDRYVGFSAQGEFAVISLLKMFPVVPSYQCYKNGSDYFLEVGVWGDESE